MLIYEFTTTEMAQACLDAVHGMAKGYWQEAGFTVNDTGVVGKRNGVDDLTAQETTKWDDVKTSPDGTFYFTSLSTDPKFPNATQMLEDAGFVFVEKDTPADWTATDYG